MGLKYDFDIFTIMPDEIFENEKLLELLDQSGIKRRAPQNKIALFRDVKTADALRAMSPNIRQLFLNSGFGLNTYDSGAPDGCYPEKDKPTRDHIIRQFIQNMKRTRLRGEYCGDFDMSEFLTYLLSAQALPEPKGRKHARTQRIRDDVEPAAPFRQSVLARVGFSIGLAVVLFALYKCLSATLWN